MTSATTFISALLKPAVGSSMSCIRFHPRKVMQQFDEVWWYVVPSAVDRVTKLVAENRADDFVSVRAWGGEAIPR